MILNWVAPIKISVNSSVKVTFVLSFNEVYSVFATVCNYTHFTNHTCATKITNTGCTLRNYRSNSTETYSIYATCLAIGY